MATPTTYTVNAVNSARGTAHLIGTFDNAVAAETYAVEQAALSRTFVSYEVWTGTPRQPGRPTGFVAKGTK